VHVITRKRLKEAIVRDRTLAAPLNVWYKVAKAAEWTSLADVRKTYPSADFVDPYTVFNIKGNHCRLITKIEYRWGLVFIKHVLTHAQYDKGDWKK
jgi:mRNA interferase HigB